MSGNPIHVSFQNISDKDKNDMRKEAKLTERTKEKKE